MNLGAPRVEVTRGSSPCGWCLRMPFLNFPSTPFIQLNLSLLLTNMSHPRYHFVCYLEQTSRNALPLLPLSPLFPSACALLNSLAALFPTPVLCFQQVPHSFPKTPGVAHPFGISSVAPKRKNASL